MLIATMPEDNTIDLLEAKSAETNGKSLNINTLVERYHHFQSLVWPIIMIVQNIAYIVRWKCPRKTIQAWVVSLLLCLSTEKYYLLLLFMALLIMVAILGWFFRLNYTLVQDQQNQWSAHTHPSKVIPEAILDDSSKHEMRIEQKKQIVAECRKMIQDLLQVLDQTCQLLETFYNLLSWNSVQKSVVFYCSATLALLSSFLLPLYFSLSIHVCLIFGANPGFFNYLQNFDAVSDSLDAVHLDAAASSSPPKPEITINTDADGITSENVKTKQFEPETCVGEPEGDTKEYTQEEDGGSLFTSEKSIHDAEELNHKLLEKGECSACAAPFTNFRKRRRYCRHCGNQFCPKCCNKKLPRSAFGATSPAAKVEKELVCNHCWMVLTN